MKTYLLALTTFFCFNSYANNNASIPGDTVTGLIDKAAALVMIDEGRKLFAEGRSRDALQSFREASIKDPNSWKGPYWVAMCHYNLNNYGYSLQYAKEAIEKDVEDVDKEVYELLGRSYHRLGILDSAKMNYAIALSKMSSSRIKELNVEMKLKQCEFAQMLMEKNPVELRMPLSDAVNSGYGDYSPVLTQNGKVLYFVSRRANTTGGGQNPFDQEYYEDIYRTVWNDKTKNWDSLSNNLGKMNTDGFDALSYIAPDGSYAITTLNTTVVDDKPVTKVSDICEVKVDRNGKWSAPKLIKNKSINTSYFDGAPTLTADGNTMYFVSDRKGDKSKSDIYVVQKNGKSWGDAKPLSTVINTVGNETTPYISPDGKYLFFSSDGHLGMGGYDVYVSAWNGSEWSTPVNLGASYNTVNNDTHFQYYPDLQKAMMATFTIIGNKASLDIFEINMANFVYPQ